MPVIRMAFGPLPEQKKEELIERISLTAAGVTGIPLEKFVVLLEEFPTENIGVGGKSLKKIFSED